MGWKWVDDDDNEPLDSISSPKGLGDLVNPNPRNSMEERSSTRRIVKSSCRTEEVEPGRFIRKCDKTEQILRESLGRYSILAIKIYFLMYFLVILAIISLLWTVAMRF